MVVEGIEESMTPYPIFESLNILRLGSHEQCGDRPWQALDHDHTVFVNTPVSIERGIGWEDHHVGVIDGCNGTNIWVRVAFFEEPTKELIEELESSNGIFGIWNEVIGHAILVLDVGVPGVLITLWRD